ncbi:MAG: helix-turn-helix domain-containing protein [Candidatus Delongbacteria bacterium]|nr:helix-turn-helix domain-containing protein [Candidatus Delongbacteria bacterium]MDD4204463.1 helix-turn-helix domain-containing protein [Candidatus Delongbacteria bacterium]
MVNKKLKYPLHFKKEVCEYAKKENIISAAVIYSVHRNTVQNWMKKYKKSGVKGFIVKRNDTQETKLDEKTLEKIARYKRKNPKATLGEIKIKFRLDCHVTLICKKLKKLYKPVKKSSGSNTLYLRTKIIREKEKNSNPVFRLSLHLCGGKPLSVGFTTSYSSEKICLFIRYSLEKLKNAKKRRLFTAVAVKPKFIKAEDFKTIVAADHDIELKVIDAAGDLNVCKEKDIGHSEKNIRNSIIDSYERIMNNYDTKSLNDILLASLVNIDELNKKELFSKGWDSLLMPAETKKSLYAALERIKRKGDRAVINFDYATAKEEYDKAYSAVSVLKVEDKKMRLPLLLSRAKLLYNTEKHHAALMIFRDIVRFAKDEKEFTTELADTYYHIAMIHRSFSNTDGAVKYFRLSAKTVSQCRTVLQKCMYYRAKYRNFLARGKYTESKKFSGMYYEYALKTNDKVLIGNCLTTRGIYTYNEGEYEEFEKQQLEAKQYNMLNKNYLDAGNNITNLLSVYSYYILKEENEINNLIKELEKVSKMINMPHLLYESMYRIGIFYYNKNRHEDALAILRRSLPGVKKYLTTEAYLSTLCYIGGIYYDKGKISQASKLLIPLIKESVRHKNDVYLQRGIWYMSKIYLTRNDINRAVGLITKGIKSSIELKNEYACAEYHKMYAELCESKGMKNIAVYHYKQAYNLYNLYMKKTNYDLSDKIEEISSKITYSKN